MHEHWLSCMRCQSSTLDEVTNYTLFSSESVKYSTTQKLSQDHTSWGYAKTSFDCLGCRTNIGCCAVEIASSFSAHLPMYLIFSTYDAQRPQRARDSSDKPALPIPDSTPGGSPDTTTIHSSFPSICAQPPCPKFWHSTKTRSA